MEKSYINLVKNYFSKNGNDFALVLKEKSPSNFTRLKTLKDYKKIIGDVKLGKKLGSGKNASVHAHENVAIKVIKHVKYDDLPLIKGEHEAKMLKFIQNKITFNLASPCIITFYQFIPGKKEDYIVLERLGQSFWQYLQKDPDIYIIKSIIVQIMFTLAVLQAMVPSFRHNDLKVDNILLDLSPRTESIYLNYRGNFWEIKRSDPIAKISDFDFAYTDKIPNCKVGTDYSSTFGCTTAKSKIYDVHVFLNSLYGYHTCYDGVVKEWLENLLPQSVLGNSNKNVRYGRLRKPENWDIPRPLQVLADPFLREFRVKSVPDHGDTWGY